MDEQTALRELVRLQKLEHPRGETWRSNLAGRTHIERLTNYIKRSLQKAVSHERGSLQKDVSHERDDEELNKWYAEWRDTAIKLGLPTELPPPPEPEPPTEEEKAEMERMTSGVMKMVEEMRERHAREREAYQMAEAKKRGYAEMDTGYSSGSGSESEGERFSAEELRLRAMNKHRKIEEKVAEEYLAEKMGQLGVVDRSKVFGERMDRPDKEITGATTGYGVHLVSGETHGKAKLTADQVQEIRRLYWMGGIKKSGGKGGRKEYSHHDLAEQFGVSPTAIASILYRNTWYTLPLVENEPSEQLKKLTYNEQKVIKLFKEKYGGTEEQLIRNKYGRLALPPEIAMAEREAGIEKRRATKQKKLEEKE